MKAVRGLLKLAALVVGGAVTFVSLMALTGSFVSNGWARCGIAIVVALVVPLVLVELALRGRPADKQAGVITDMLALTYMGFSLAFVGAAHAYSRPLLQSEGRRLEGAGMKRVAQVAYVLAGGADPKAAPVVVVEKPQMQPPPEAPVALRAGDGKERTPAQIFTDFAPSVVTISVKGMLGEGGGTGFLIDANGTIGTNYHVIAHAEKLEVKLMDGTIADEVELLVENQPQDLALLRIKTKHALAPVVLGDSDKLVVGERAVSIGNPLGLEHTLTDGVVSSRRVIEGKKMIQMSTPVSPGNSGGPLFNARGEVIGVTTANYGALLGQNLNLAMPINDLKAMIRAEYPGRHKVGEESAKGGRW